MLIPDNVDIYSFLFEYQPPLSKGYDVPAPVRRSAVSERENRPWLVDALSGRSLTFRECKDRANAIAQAFSSLGVGHVSNV